MEFRDWITIISALIVAVGWFVNSHLNRKHEIAKKRLEHRLSALQSFMPVAFSLSQEADPFTTNPQLLNKLKWVVNNFQLYGTAEEIKMMDNLVKAPTDRDIDGFKTAYSALYNCVRKQLRKELRINI